MTFEEALKVFEVAVKDFKKEHKAGVITLRVELNNGGYSAIVVEGQHKNKLL